MSAGIPNIGSEVIPKDLRDLLCQYNSNIFLVGGSVRDIFLNRKSHDYDFVFEGDFKNYARKIANKLDGHFFILDKVRKTYRIIYYNNDMQRKILDFAELKNGDINTDLKLRDFSINAIAINVKNLKEHYDPLDGIKDIKEKNIRACSSDAFIDDPIRILRAVRLAYSLNFKIQNDTIKWLREAISFLKNISFERIRDELFLMLDSDSVHSMLLSLSHLGVLDFIFVNLIYNEQQYLDSDRNLNVLFNTIRRYMDLHHLLINRDRSHQAENLLTGITIAEIGKYRRHLREHYKEKVSIDRSLKSIDIFSIIYYFYNNRLYNPDNIFFFKLSKKENDFIKQIISHEQIVYDWLVYGKIPENIDVYRYFKRSGNYGIDACILSMARVLAGYEYDLTPENWKTSLAISRKIFEAWFEKKDILVDPPKFLNGNDIINVMNLKSGIKVGRILDKISEAQVLGIIKSKDDAVQYALRVFNELE